MLKFIIKSWINIKVSWAKKNGLIGNLSKEVDSVKALFPEGLFYSMIGTPFYDILVNKKIIEYKPDLLGTSQWDYQYDSNQVIQRGGADCNSLNRLIQMIYYIMGYESCLVTYIAKPFTMSHGTCVLKKDNKFIPCDYSHYTDQSFDTMKECIDFIATKYNAKVRVYAVQNILWNFIEI